MDYIYKEIEINAEEEYIENICDAIGGDKKAIIM